MVRCFRDCDNNHDDKLDEEFSEEIRFCYANPDEILDPDEDDPNEDIDPDCNGDCERCPDADYCLYGVL